MSPKTIAEELSSKHIQLAALTDHNTTLNSPAFAIHCRNNNVAALYGMEAQTAEEIHVVTLFTTVEMALDFCAGWYDTLPNIPNKPEVTGDQIYVDEKDDMPFPAITEHKGTIEFGNKNLKIASISHLPFSEFNAFMAPLFAIPDTNIVVNFHKDDNIDKINKLM